MVELLYGSWNDPQNIRPETFRCGHCDAWVGSDRGYACFSGNFRTATIMLCPLCNRASYLEGGRQWPGIAFGGRVEHLPLDVASLYEEARAATAACASTLAVLGARKLLMNIAVDKGAEPGNTFEHYVDYLASKGYVSPDGRGWVDHIRKKGNEANHEIALMNQADAKELLTFVEMLLKVTMSSQAAYRRHHETRTRYVCLSG